MINSIIMLLQQTPLPLPTTRDASDQGCGASNNKAAGCPPTPIDDYIPLVLLLVGVIAMYYIYKKTKQCQKE